MSHFFVPTVLVLVAARGIGAQSTMPLGATSNVDRVAAIGTRSPVELRLSRPLAEGEGELALVVGGMDVTAVSDRTDSSIVYRPTALPLPEGNADAERSAGAASRSRQRFRANAPESRPLYAQSLRESAE